MLVLVGESASGKSSIEKELVEKYKFKKIISYTTRKPRDGEIDGVDYHFIDKQKFLELKDKNFFAETSMYNGWYYGSAKKDYKDSDNKIIALTPNGLRQICNLKDIFVVSFYINVPRKDRLIKMLQCGDNIDEAYNINLSDTIRFDNIKEEVNYIIDNPEYIFSAEEMAEEIINKIIF